MPQDRNPQATQMGDATMARTLACQAEAIWPQEQRLFDRYRLQGELRILDLGCGTGEITRRLAVRYPQASVLGVDILGSNLKIARQQSRALASRVQYARGDAFELQYEAAAFDLVVCRHMSQAVPDFAQVLAEITRVLRPDGWLHLLAEDYAMLHFPVPDPLAFDPDRFWNTHALGYLHSIGCDGRSGRHAPALLADSGYLDIAMDYVVVDTLRVSREIFAGILSAWRDGYAPTLAVVHDRELSQVLADFERMIAAVRTPPNYAVWQVPVASARRPEVLAATITLSCGGQL